MDPALAEAFAGILDEVWSQPWLGNATTAQLLGELQARIETTPQPRAGYRGTDLRRTWLDAVRRESTEAELAYRTVGDDGG